MTALVLIFFAVGLFAVGLIAGLCFGMVIGAKQVDRYWRNLTPGQAEQRRQS